MSVNRLFTRSDTWLCQDGTVATIGISDYAQQQLGSIVFLNLPDVGADVRAGESFGDVESTKTVSDLISPADGKVTKVNRELLDEPENINDSPYDCWMIEIQVERVSDELLTEDDYLQYREMK